jgi:hypothetical protein
MCNFLNTPNKCPSNIPVTETFKNKCRFFDSFKNLKKEIVQHYYKKIALLVTVPKNFAIILSLYDNDIRCKAYIPVYISEFYNYVMHGDYDGYSTDMFKAFTDDFDVLDDVFNLTVKQYGLLKDMKIYRDQ